MRFAVVAAFRAQAVHWKCRNSVQFNRLFLTLTSDSWTPKKHCTTRCNLLALWMGIPSVWRTQRHTCIYCRVRAYLEIVVYSEVYEVNINIVQIITLNKGKFCLPVVNSECFHWRHYFCCSRQPASRRAVVVRHQLAPSTNSNFTLLERFWSYTFIYRGGGLRLLYELINTRITIAGIYTKTWNSNQSPIFLW